MPAPAAPSATSSAFIGYRQRSAGAEQRLQIAYRQLLTITAELGHQAEQVGVALKS